MASPNTQDKLQLYKFTKILTLKVAQIVVQSRQGKKITNDYHTDKEEPNDLSTSPNLQLFNLSIPDEPNVNTDAKKILNGEVVMALSNILCIEISLQTNDGDEMVLELWTVKILPDCSTSINSVATIYYRMSIMLKSTLSISRITPAYKLSREQNNESYTISHRIYGGTPNLTVLGDNYKIIKVSELETPIGTISIGVDYRTSMTMLPKENQRALTHINANNGDIMLKSDHFHTDRIKKDEKKGIDLNKPLTAGAFVDIEKIKQLHDTLSQQLPPEPPMAWLLAEKEKVENRLKYMSISESPSNKIEANGQTSCSAPNSSKAIEVPKSKDSKYSSLMEFPFADGSPITELASFYQECLQAKSNSGDWTEISEESTTNDGPLGEQLKMFEDAVPEFDNMVASMFSNSDQSDNS